MKAEIMLDALKKFFSSEPKEDDTGEVDTRVAAAALLVETALSDGVYAEIEESRLLEIMIETFDIDDVEARSLLSKAEDVAEGASGAHQFTKIVKTLEEPKREKIVEGLYYLTLADGEKCPFEDAFVRHVASLLHVPDRPRAEARQRAELRHADAGN